jgi:hypothetical protein
MKIKKFIKSVAHFLGLGDYKIEGKKKALKDLIKKLNKRKREMKKKIKETPVKKDKKELEEELEIVSLELKKAKSVLYKLYFKQNTK